MKPRKLGSTNIDISPIGLGTNYVGGHNAYTNIDESQGVKLVQKAIDEGITFIDTADLYGLGRSEELVGQVIAGQRDKVVLATKGGNIFEVGKRGGVSNTPEYLETALDASLKRLGTDYIDLYYIHRPDGKTPPEEAFGALMRFKEQGKIRAAGLSNFGLADIAAAQKAGPVDAVQNRFNLLEREEEIATLPFCEANRISFIPWGPLAYGILAGKYEPGYTLEEGDWRNRTGLFEPAVYEQKLKIVEKLKGIAVKMNTTPANIAIAWLLSKPALGSVIAGAKTAGQVSQNRAAENVVLDENTLEQIDVLTR
jgi:aryl-alcohol dehydrogenase-like predicted oxidoreductase